MTDEKTSREEEPTQEDLTEAFSEQFTQVAEEGLRSHPGPVPEDLQAQIRTQTQVAVLQTSEALAGAIYPNLIKWWDAKVFPLSQSVQEQRAAVQAVVAAQTTAQEVVNERTEITDTLIETTNLTQSVVTVNTSSGVDFSSLVLWRWNETDVSQFTQLIARGALTASLVYKADSSDQVSPGIQINVTSTDQFMGGFVLWKIADSENFTLPEKFLVRVRYASHSFSDIGTAVSMYHGPFFHNDNANDLYGFGIALNSGGAFCIIPNAEGSGSTPAGPNHLQNAPFKWESGTPSSPQITASGQPATGTTVEFECFLKSFSYPDPPFCSVTMRKLGGYGTAQIETQNIYSQSFLRGRSARAGGIYSGWSAQTVNKFGWLITPPFNSVLTNKNYEITDLCILKHPTDW